MAQRAAHLYFTPTISFLDGANAWVRAAKDLGYGTAAVRQAWQDVGLWQVCGDRTTEGAFTFLADQGVYVSAPAKTPVSVGNWTYSADNGAPQEFCGVSFRVTQLPLPSREGISPTGNPNLYVGVNRVPDPAALVWDCVVDNAYTLAGSPSGPTQPSCDLPLEDNATYYVVALGQQEWAGFSFFVTPWGRQPVDQPLLGGGEVTAAAMARRSLSQMGGEAAAPGLRASKCFDGGKCKGAGGCESGRCRKGYCVK